MPAQTRSARRRNASTLTLAMLLAAMPARADDDIARINGIVEASVAKHEFMGAVLVARNGKVLLNQGYGYANLEWQVKNTPEGKFRIGSMTKQFTAAAILLLEQRGKLSINDPIGKYLPDAPPTWAKVTLFHLLNHSSGIVSITSVPDFQVWMRQSMTPDEAINHVRKLPLEFEPGSRWAYSNSGYILLGRVIERVSGQGYADFLQENFFKPLHMQDTGYDRSEQVLPHRVSGYETGSEGLRNDDFADMGIPFSAGGLVSTTDDLLRWEAGLYGGQVLSAASLKKMTTAYLGGYGFGLFTRKIQGHQVFEHGGNINGFASSMEYFPDDGLTVIVLSNVGGGIAEELSGRINGVELK